MLQRPWRPARRVYQVVGRLLKRPIACCGTGSLTRPLLPVFFRTLGCRFLEKTGHDGLNRILAGYEDKSAYAQCVFSFCAGPGAEIKTFVGQTPGTIVPARGPTDFGWDPIFQPDGFTETYAELDKEVKNTISHRFRALDKLRTYLTKEADAVEAATVAAAGASGGAGAE